MGSVLKLRSIKTSLHCIQLKREKNLGLNGIRTRDLCDTGAVLYQLSFQAIWKLVSF